jgi:hypothetical protein
MNRFPNQIVDESGSHDAGTSRVWSSKVQKRRHKFAYNRYLGNFSKHLEGA